MNRDTEPGYPAFHLVLYVIALGALLVILVGMAQR